MKATVWGALMGAVLAIGPAGAQTYRYVSRPADAPSFDPEAGAVTIVSEGGGYRYRSVAERPGDPLGSWKFAWGRREGCGAPSRRRTAADRA